MNRQDIEEYAKSASPHYSLICVMVGHIVYEDEEKLRCARCGKVFEGDEKEEPMKSLNHRS